MGNLELDDLLRELSDDYDPAEEIVRELYPEHDLTFGHLNDEESETDD